MKILDLLMQIKAIPSRSEARRLVAQGAVKLDGQPVQVWDDEVLDGKHEVLVGRTHHFEVVVKNGDKDPLHEVVANAPKQSLSSVKEPLPEGAIVHLIALVRRVAKLGCYGLRCLNCKTASVLCEPCAARRCLRDYLKE